MATNDGRRDAAGIGPYLREGVRLASLRKLGWQVAGNDADVRGWEVRTVSGRVIGTVHDLLVDQDVGEVVLLDLDLAGTSRRGLLPIRAAEIDRGRRVILVDSADVRDAEEFSTSARAAGHQGLAEREAYHDAALRESAHRHVTDVRTVRSVPRGEFVSEPVVNRMPPTPVAPAVPVTAQTVTPGVPVAPVAPAAAAPSDQVVVEEVVVRRRVVDAADLPAAEAGGAQVVRDQYGNPVVDDRLR